MEQDELRENLTEPGTWMRGLSMLLFFVIYILLYQLAQLVLVAVSVAQFVIKLITGSVNDRLLDVGYSTSTYIYQVYLFLTFASDERPFPFSPWPERPKHHDSGVHAAAPSHGDNDDDEPHLGV